MNEYQITLFNDLIHLVDTNEAFFYKDHVKAGITFRIFNYRLASYTDFLLPNAMECRGHMFRMGGVLCHDIPDELVSLPVEKFFNLHENPFTENVDLSTVQTIMNKEDGSLISTYLIRGVLYLKSKASLESDQCVDAMKWLKKNPLLETELRSLTKFGYTINMEWTSPHNRIVLGYEKEGLIILNVRSRIIGDHVPKCMFSCYPNMLESWVSEDLWYEYSRRYDCGSTAQEFVLAIPSMEEIEGFVVETNEGQLIKIKTDWYLTRHRAKDSINAPRRLFEAIVNEAIDDVKTLFHGDDIALKIISDMETLVEPKFNHMIETVEKFHEENKDLTRKEYAIKAHSLDDGFMPLYMNAFLSRDINYKEFAIKNHERFIGKVNDEC